MGSISSKLDQAKNWWESKTIIATILGIVSTVLGLFGIDIGDLVNVSFAEATDVAGQIDSIWVSLQALFFGAIAAWGRIKAQVKIK